MAVSPACPHVLCGRGRLTGAVSRSLPAFLVGGKVAARGSNSVSGRRTAARRLPCERPVRCGLSGSAPDSWFYAVAALAFCCFLALAAASIAASWASRSLTVSAGSSAFCAGHAVPFAFAMIIARWLRRVLS